MDLFAAPSKKEIDERRELRLVECAKTHELQIGIAIPYGILVIGCPDCGFIQNGDKLKLPCTEGTGESIFYPRSIFCARMERDYSAGGLNWNDGTLSGRLPRTKMTFEVVI